jgi:hypothetical protein
MNNKEKQYLAGLESRVLRLENILEAITQGIGGPSQYSYNCNQCGAWDPVKNNYVCGQVDCCQGLNPSDDD